MENNVEKLYVYIHIFGYEVKGFTMLFKSLTLI